MTEEAGMSEDTYDVRAAHGARTQSLFRDVNERVRQINDAFSIALPLGDWVCECANDACTSRVALSPADYERIRSNPARFVVLPNEVHVDHTIENVVERHEAYWIVEKTGDAAELAALVDPRAVGVRGQRQTAAAS
jgi:hypothetical protein